MPKMASTLVHSPPTSHLISSPKSSKLSSACCPQNNSSISTRAMQRNAFNLTGSLTLTLSPLLTPPISSTVALLLHEDSGKLNSLPKSSKFQIGQWSCTLHDFSPHEWHGGGWRAHTIAISAIQLEQPNPSLHPSYNRRGSSQKHVDQSI